MIKLNGKNNSEIIVNYIINKIISLTITKSTLSEINKRIPQKCCDYCEESINSLISSLYIFYDKDEERNINEKMIFNSDIEEIKNNEVNNFKSIDLICNENESILNNYFFNNHNLGENNWDLIDEPKSTNIDRYATTFIKLEERNLGLGDKYQINQEKILEEEEYKEINRNSVVHTTAKKNKPSFVGSVNLNINHYNKNDVEKNKKIRMSDLMNQFKTIDLEPEKNYENKQIVKLREIFEKDKNEKEKHKQINKEEKEKIIINRKLEEEIVKKYIGKKINKDHNGEIIFIKAINPKDLKKDFIFSGSKIKASIKIETSKLNKEIKEKPKEIIVEKNDINKKNEKNKKYSKSNNPRPSKLTNTTKSNNKHKEIRPIALRKDIPLIISGSNFYLMDMEVGVSIKEDEKYKTGGLDFFNKYKKYSLEVYNKKLKESETINNIMKKTDKFNETNTQTIGETNNLYKTNYTLGNSIYDGYNTVSDLITDTNNLNKKTMYLTNNNISSVFHNYSKQTNMSTNKDKNNLNITPIINVRLGSSSLVDSFDKLNLISNEEKMIKNKTKNLFREKTKKIKKYILNDMNSFTKNLITHKIDEKMNTTGGIKGIKYPGKPGVREIIQEIGLKGKITRQRRKFLPIIKSKFLDNENFFKQ